jgi:hypothetical protein
VAVDRADNVYVADQPNSTICKVTLTGTTTTVAGTTGAAGVLLGGVWLFHVALDGSSFDHLTSLRRGRVGGSGLGITPLA